MQDNRESRKRHHLARRRMGASFHRGSPRAGSGPSWVARGSCRASPRYGSVGTSRHHHDEKMRPRRIESGKQENRNQAGIRQCVSPPPRPKMAALNCRAERNFIPTGRTVQQASRPRFEPNYLVPDAATGSCFPVFQIQIPAPTPAGPHRRRPSRRSLPRGR